MIKFLIKTFFLFVVLAFLSACAANSTTGSINVQNQSGIDAANIKVGSNTIGTVIKGQSNTVYFYTSENNAKISIDGVKPSQVFDYSQLEYVDADGKINLKTNYIYTLQIYKNNNNKIVYYISGNKVDGKSDDYEQMK